MYGDRSDVVSMVAASRPGHRHRVTNGVWLPLMVVVCCGFSQSVPTGFVLKMFKEFLWNDLNYLCSVPCPQIWQISSNACVQPTRSFIK